MIAVTFALRAESSSFLKLLENTTRDADGIIAGTLHEHDVTVVHTGVGAKAATRALARFLTKQRPRILISSGFAGAVNDRLQVGDLFLAENFSAPELGATATARLAERRMSVGNIRSMPAVIDSLQARQEIARAGEVAAVDMESEAIAQVCASAGVPMLSFRVISDTPAQPLPAPPEVLFDIEQQRTRWSALLFYVARHPSAAVKLTHFAKRARCARDSLAVGLELLLGSDFDLRARL